MRKILIIVLFHLIFSNVVIAEDVCEKEEKFSQIWYYNNCDGKILQSTDQKPNKSHLKKGKNNPWKGYPYNSGEIPEDAKPDEKILKHYLKKYISYSKLENRPGFKIKKSKNFK